MKYKTLTELGTAICDALREKLGTNESIQIQDVPEKIKEIKSTDGYGKSKIILNSSLLNLSSLSYSETTPPKSSTGLSFESVDNFIIITNKEE